MFDFDRDGSLNWVERGSRDAFVMNIIGETESRGKNTDSDSSRDDRYEDRD